MEPFCLRPWLTRWICLFAKVGVSMDSRIRCLRSAHAYASAARTKYLNSKVELVQLHFVSCSIQPDQVHINGHLERWNRKEMHTFADVLAGDFFVFNSR